jgi:hypothetical protein
LFHFDTYFLRRTTDKIYILSSSSKWHAMALFSFRHSVKSFSSKCGDPARMARLGQTEAHIRYITRPRAARSVIAQRLAGGDPLSTARQCEVAAEASGGRVCERFVIALPCEASPHQRAELGRAFAEALTKGNAGYILAIHDKAGNDLRNPHLHLVAFDAFERSGGRGRPRSCLGMARKDAVEKAAALWAKTHNELMSAWDFGQETMITNLSFAARGLDRVPTVHEGAGARSLAAKGITPKPKPEWHHIDQGHSRAEANQVISEINKMGRENEERPDRLGSDDACDATRGGEGGANGRTSVGGSRRDVAPARPPFHRNAAGPIDADKGIETAATAAPPFAATAAGTAEKAVAPFLGGVPALRRWRRVRRVFRELTMLRGTLRARLAPARTREPFFVPGRAAPHPREATRLPMNSRRSETGQREE